MTRTCSLSELRSQAGGLLTTKHKDTYLTVSYGMEKGFFANSRLQNYHLASESVKHVIHIEQKLRSQPCGL